MRLILQLTTDDDGRSLSQPMVMEVPRDVTGEPRSPEAVQALADFGAAVVLRVVRLVDASRGGDAHGTTT